MKTVSSFCLAALCLVGLVVVAGSSVSGQRASAANDGWISLFDGKSLDGWKMSGNQTTFTVADGAIVVNGPRSHLYYTGPVENHEFKNFEWKADVMTFPGSNSGMYFHTTWQDDGWPDKGFEVQVNNSHTDPKRTGGLYDIKDNYEAPAKDNEWFTQLIIVQGKHVVIKVNGKTITDYTEPDDFAPKADHAGRRISSGTFALQGHDPKSKVLYKNIMVKPLP
jgi:hypothetical protein